MAAIVDLDAHTTRPQFVTFGLSFIVLYIAYLSLSAVYSAYYGPLSHIPGPKLRALSFWPQSLSIWTGSDHLDTLALHKRYGPVVRTSPGSISYIGTSEVWKNIYGFTKNGTAENGKDRIFYTPPLNGVDHLVRADYDQHSRQRKVVSHAFSDKALKEQEPMLRMWATRMKQFLEKKANEGSKVDMVHAFNCTTFDIMADLTFGESLHMLEEGEYTPWVKAVFAGVKFVTKMRAIRILNPWIQYLLERSLKQIPAMKRKAEAHWRYTASRLDKRLATTADRPDLWTRILEKGGDPRKGASSLSLEEHYSNAWLFMLAGTETTATALSGTLFHLSKTPELFTTLRDELRRRFNSIEDMNLNNLAQIPLLDAVLKEGMRLYPPVPVGLPRVSPKGGCTVSGQEVPAETSMSIPQYATYRSEDNFKYATRFCPSRWLGDKTFENDNLGGFEPFSIGPRGCIGKNLAWHEMRLLFAVVMVHFDIQLCQESATWTDQKMYLLWEKKELMCEMKVVQNH